MVYTISNSQVNPQTTEVSAVNVMPQMDVHPEVAALLGPLKSVDWVSGMYLGIYIQSTGTLLQVPEVSRLEDTLVCSRHV